MQSEEFIEQHGGGRRPSPARLGRSASHGQERKYHLAVAGRDEHGIRGIDFNFGGVLGDTQTTCTDLRADFVMANPPFKYEEGWNENGQRPAL